MAACLDSLRALRYPATRGGGRRRRVHGPHGRDRRPLRGHPRHPPGEQGAERGAQCRHGGVHGRDHRLHRFGLRRRSRLAPLSGRDVPLLGAARGRRAESAAARGLLRRIVCGRLTGRAARGAARRRGGRAYPGLQHGIPTRGARGDRGLRPGVPRRRGRRRRLLAPAESRLPHRLEPRGDGVALPAQYGQGVYRAAARATARRRRCCTSAIRTASTRSAMRAGAGGSMAASRRSCRWPRPVVYGGVYGRGLFQTLYPPPSSLLAHLPFTLEWNVVALGLLAYAIAHGGHAWLGVLPLTLTWAACLAAAAPRTGRCARHRHRAAARSSGS